MTVGSPADHDPARLSAVDLAAAIRARRISAMEATEACLSNIARLDPELHAFVTVAAESARARAADLDVMAARGRFAGPLHGVPVSVKDLIATRGIRTTRGSRLHENAVPDEDDLSVARLRAAGAVILGKTNTPEWGFGALCSNAVAGNTVNPYARDRSSGGSSGGSAVAVATGMSALSLGTDFGGSVRTPAAFCNVLGFRPSAGAIPLVPKRFAWDCLPSHGILARTAPDAALMLLVLAGPDPRDPVSGAAADRSASRLPQRMSAVRVAASSNLGLTEIDGTVEAAFDAAIRRLERLSPVTRAAPDMTGAQHAFETIRAAHLFFEHGATLRDNPDALSSAFKWNVSRGAHLSARDYLDAERVRSEIRLRCLAFFEDHDVLAIPAAAVPPFPLQQENVGEVNGRPTRNIIDYLTITYAISLIGFPSLSVPAGWISGTLPFGLQLVAAPGNDLSLLAFAGRLEATEGFGHSFP